MTDGLLRDVSRLFGTKGRSYIYIANGHGAWEAALTNVLSRGDHVLVLESGRFAIGWGDAAQRMGCEVEILKGGLRRAVRPAEVETRLKADMAAPGGPKIKAILVAQIDTASGVVNDIKAIGAAVKAARHEALLMVDTVASLACMPFEMDAWGVDVAMSGSQKGLMTPPGLGFVAANARARKIHETANLRTPYWDWTAREGELHYQKYAGTPPEHLMFGLRQALDMLFAEGLDNVFRRHHLLAEATRRAVGVWSQGQALSFNIEEARRTLGYGDDGADARQAAVPGDARLCPREVRRRRRHRHRGTVGPGVSHRPHGPHQRADDARHAQRDRDGARRA